MTHRQWETKRSRWSSCEIIHSIILADRWWATPVCGKGAPLSPSGVSLIALDGGKGVLRVLSPGQCWVSGVAFQTRACARAHRTARACTQRRLLTLS